MANATREEVISNLCPAFQDDFARLVTERFGQSEKITWAADAAVVGDWVRPAGGFGGSSGYYKENPLIGYWVLTSKRLVRVWFLPSLGRWTGRKYISERRRDWPALEWRLICRPSDALSTDETRSREVKETQVSRVIDVNLNQLDWQAATLFTIGVSVLGQSQFIQSAFWHRRDAEILYNALRDLSQTNLPATLGAGGSAGATDLLEALGRLHAAGVLTDDEFAKKKQELLDRI